MSTARLSTRDYKALSALLTSWTGINLHAKEHLMLGRLQPRLRALGLKTFHDYYVLLEEGGRQGPEAQQFINALTTNKTSFFRESHHFDFLVQRVFPEARAREARTGKKMLRLWSAGCSRGAEPYSMALLAAEHLPAAQGWDVRILATDLDTDVLAEAQRGVYPAAEAEEIPESLRKRFLTPVDQGYRIQPQVASLVTFAQANLIAEPFPIRGRFDVIFCRNVMIYFEHAIQQRLVREFVARLPPTGYLVIGHSESMVAHHLPRMNDTVGVYRPPAGASVEASAKAAAPARLPAPALAPAAAPRVNVAHRSGSGRNVRARQPVPGLPLKRIVLGEWFATKESMLVSTLLGSCVAACLHDPVAKIGGMNHFMLPKVSSPEANSARFGVHAMEVLINELMQLGADRQRLRAMVFGAGAVNRNLTSKVAQQNGAFVRQFLAQERIPIIAERLGGEEPREVVLRTDTGEAFVRRVKAQRAVQLQKTELAAYSQPVKQPDTFNPDDALF